MTPEQIIALSAQATTNVNQVRARQLLAAMILRYSTSTEWTLRDVCEQLNYTRRHLCSQIGHLNWYLHWVANEEKRRSYRELWPAWKVPTTKRAHYTLSPKTVELFLYQLDLRQKAALQTTNMDLLDIIDRDAPRMAERLRNL